MSISPSYSLSPLPFSFPFPPPQNPNPRIITPLSSQTPTLTLDSDNKIVERGVEFSAGDSFFRSESSTGRDLAVLSAALHRRSNGRLRVLDAMCGCGVRSLRYLSQADADFVWANDANEDYRGTILSNLSGIPRVSEGGERRWVVTHSDANRVLVESYLHRDFFDLVDVDSFGSDSMFLRSSVAALKIGGLLYVTSTDGYSSGGHRPQQ